MSAMLDAQSQTSGSSSGSDTQSSALKDLFSLLDGNGDGGISKSEFESALGAGGTNTANADSVFSQLDKNGDGSVSSDELGSALKSSGGHHGHHHMGGAGGASGSVGFVEQFHRCLGNQDHDHHQC
jgi:Ca2+-binding EF-hand superfamily protein